MNIEVKRVYAKPEPKDGFRILVDRLWPRGLTKEKAAADLWLKEIAPSTELRKWFAHDPEKWPEFKKRYVAELKENPAVAQIRDHLQKGKVCLLYAARDEVHNEAQVLKDFLSKNSTRSQ